MWFCLGVGTEWTFLPPPPHSNMLLASLPLICKTPTREALEKLYESTHGAAWRRKSNWLSESRGVCKWHGVECSHGEVTSIDLGGNDVAGTLPASLASLTALRVLNIDDSRLSGTLPAGNAARSLLP